MSKRKLSAYMGRFSGFHNGHAEILLRALRLSEKVLVVIGSAKQPRRVKNPWTAQERADIIQDWYREEFKRDPTLGQLVFEFSRDYMYNNQKWLLHTQELMAKHASADEPIYVVGADRDRTTFYLKMFPKPKYELDLTPENERVSRFLTATSVRDIYFGRMFNNATVSDEQVDLLLRSFLPPSTLKYMIDWMDTDAYTNLWHEYNAIQERKSQKNGSKYPILVQTVDAVVIQTGHILLVRRKNYPGKGLWALPGGHLNEFEWMLDGAIRELKEETKLKVPEPVLFGSLKFDFRLEHPDRSELGRVISQLFCFQLPDHLVNGVISLPEVMGQDDADKAKWFTLAEALEMSDQLFDDHHAAIEMCVDRLGSDKSDKRKD